MGFFGEEILYAALGDVFVSLGPGLRMMRLRVGGWVCDLLGCVFFLGVALGVFGWREVGGEDWRAMDGGWEICSY